MPRAATSDAAPVRLLFVCLGQHLPLADRRGRDAHARERGRDAGREVELDSAGTGAWHVGSAPDARATAAAARARGVALERQRAPGAAPRTSSEFDLILAMDRANLRDLRALAPDERGAREGAAAARVRPGERRRAATSTCPTPTTAPASGFEEVLRPRRRRRAGGCSTEIRAGRVP